jgi:hypothetical protein
VIVYQRKNKFEHDIDQSISNLLVTYSYCTNFFEILYLIYHKLNEKVNNKYHFLLTKFFNFLIYVYIKNYFRGTTLLIIILSFRTIDAFVHYNRRLSILGIPTPLT